MGWKSCHHCPWPLQSKLGRALSNGHCANGTHDGEMRRLRIRDRRVANDPRDSRREDKLITGHHVSIEIAERENEVRREIYGKILMRASKKRARGSVIKL